MPLSNEDTLRLNVLGAHPVKAIRINESSMTLHALTERGEAKIGLNPVDSHEAYLKDIREYLSERYLDMPGGYPTHLKRWTRMGFTSNTLEKMLLLGDPEAVVAIAYSHNLNHDIAQSAWWAYQTPEIARNLLDNQAVAEGKIAKELAQFLFEFLPFEERSLDVVDSVRLCLQAGLINDEQKADLWKRAKRKNPFFVGFLLAGPQSIPLEETAHPDWQTIQPLIAELIRKKNNYAVHFAHFLSLDGRKWLKAVEFALLKPSDPDVVTALFITLGRYIQIPFPEKHGVETIEEAHIRTTLQSDSTNGPRELTELLQALPEKMNGNLRAMMFLAQLGEDTLNPIFCGRDASGSVMRKHLKPVTQSIIKAIHALLK